MMEQSSIVQRENIHNRVRNRWDAVTKGVELSHDNRMMKHVYTDVLKESEWDCVLESLS